MMDTGQTVDTGVLCFENISYTMFRFLPAVYDP